MMGVGFFKVYVTKKSVVVGRGIKWNTGEIIIEIGTGSTGVKPIPVLLCPLKITYAISRVRARYWR
jgi:hypothetical protein